MDFITEEEYLDILEKLPRENQYLEDKILISLLLKWVLKLLFDLLANEDLDAKIL